MRSNESVVLIWSCGVLSALLRALEADEGSTGGRNHQKRSSLSLLYREKKKFVEVLQVNKSFRPE